MKTLAALLIPPHFEDDSFRTQVARLMHLLFCAGILSTITLLIVLGQGEPQERNYAYLYIVTTIVSGIVLLGLNKRGHTRLTGALALMLVSIQVIADNFVSSRWISPAHILSVIVILLSGLGFGRRGFIVTTSVHIGGLVLALIYRYNAIADRLAAHALWLDYIVQIVLLVLTTSVMWMVSSFVATLYRNNQQMARALAERNQILEREVLEHQAAIEKNRSVAQTTREIINVTHELLECETMDELWKRAVELARSRLNVERCSIYLFDHKHNIARGTFGTDIHQKTTDERQITFPLHKIEWPNPEQPLQDNDTEWRIKTDAHLIAYSESAKERHTVGQGWNAEIAIRPYKGKNIGLFYCDAAITGQDYEPAHLNLIALFCSLLGSIAERKQLTTHLNTRTRELTHMLEISRSIGSTLELKPMLNQIVLALKDVAGGDTATIAEFINDSWDCRILCTTEEHNQHLVSQIVTYNPQIDAHLHYIVNQRKPLIIPNLGDQSAFAVAFNQHLQRVNPKVLAQTGCVMAVPLIVRERVIGLCLIASSNPYTFNDYSATLAFGVANQTAALIELVRSHEAGIKAAAKSERSRLARELHDSVSQALFGIVLGLRTSLQYMDSKLDAKSTVQYALALAESGLSDIRALIFELRPEQLEKEGLVNALQKQVQAMSVRYKLDVAVNVPPEEPPLPLPAKEALYRIGMEALQNTMKHAQATKVQVKLHPEPNVWTLDIQDNGRGFDPNVIYEGHYGLNTMRERADQLGATINIISAPGAGARVSVQVPVAQENPSETTRQD